VIGKIMTGLVAATMLLATSTASASAGAIDGDITPSLEADNGGPAAAAMHPSLKSKESTERVKAFGYIVTRKGKTFECPQRRVRTSQGWRWRQNCQSRTRADVRVKCRWHQVSARTLFGRIRTRVCDLK
jgi:hypothetical protein